MISEYYPNTENSLANAIAICVRAWYEHDSKGICKSSNEDPIATYFATAFGSDIIIGEVYRNGEFRCPELDQFSCMTTWIPLIFYEITSPIRVSDDSIDLYIRIYNEFMRKTSHPDAGLIVTETNDLVQFNDVVEARRLLLQGQIGKYLRKNRDWPNKFFEFRYLYQDDYINAIAKVVEFTTKRLSTRIIDHETHLYDLDTYNELVNGIKGNLMSDPYLDIKEKTALSITRTKNDSLYEKLIETSRNKERIRQKIRNKYYIEIPPEVISDYGLDGRAIGTQFPPYPYQGMYFYRQYDRQLYMYDGTQWVQVVKPGTFKAISLHPSYYT